MFVCSCFYVCVCSVCVFVCLTRLGVRVFVSLSLCLSPPSCFRVGISMFARGATSSCCGQGLLTLGEVKSSVDHNFHSSQMQKN